MGNEAAQFVANLGQAWPTQAWRDVHTLAAVSGGADSVSLLRGLASAKQTAGGKGSLIVAHFNHKLRGEDSDADARWVDQLGRRLGLEVELGQAPPSADLHSEADAREARYHFLREVAHRRGARYVATGHTADDQVETILHRVLRGSGLAGLRGTPFSRPLSESVEIVRPLLAVTRARVEGYLQEIEQDYRTDATNAESGFTRNRLRNVVLPLLRREVGHDVDASLLRLGEQAGEAQQVIENLAKSLVEKAMRIDGDSIVIRPDLLEEVFPLTVREACKLAWRRSGWPEQAMGAEQWKRLLACVLGPRGATENLPGGVLVEHQGQRVVLRRV